MRWLPRLGVLVAGIAAALTVAVPQSNASVRPPDLAEVPPDFATVMGYQPAVGRLADGTERLINPQGECSVVGEGKPFDFAVACQAHDYGYDLLRYADLKGITLPGSARDEIDQTLTDDLLTQCTADSNVLTCDAAVAVFSSGVRFNSWRQLSGPPIDQSGLTRTAGLILLAGVGGMTAVRTRSRLRSARSDGSAGSAG